MAKKEPLTAEQIEAKLESLRLKADECDRKGAVWMMRANDIREISVPRLQMRLRKLRAAEEPS